MNPYGSAYVNGFKDYPKFIFDLAKAINDEAGAVAFYEKLAKLAPNQKQKDWIEHAKTDEAKHLRMLSALYLSLTCQNPNVQAKDVTFANYKAGVGLALDQQLEAIEFYREMYLATCIPEIRDIFYETVVAETEHSIRFSHIYNQLK